MEEVDHEQLVELIAFSKIVAMHLVNRWAYFALPLEMSNPAIIPHQLRSSGRGKKNNPFEVQGCLDVCGSSSIFHSTLKNQSF